MISVHDFSYRFHGGQRDVLQHINLEIAAGEFVVLTGPSGCGKSTLALALGAYLFSQYDGTASGEITVAGLNARRQPVYAIAEIVGLVQQNPEAQFCTLTVQDEIAFGLENRRLPRQEIRERMAWALDIVGIRALQNRPLATLSGGERQKVAIAAIMAARPQVLIFDEPTANLDPGATAEIFAVIAQIRAQVGLTVIVIEHKVDYLRHFNPRLIQMRDGAIVADQALADYASPPLSATALPAWGAQQTPAPTIAQIEHLHTGYNGTPILHDLSLHIAAGEFVAVLGDNGAGKTTLLRSLMGLLKPQSGRVKVLDKDTRSTPVSTLAREIGFVFQNPNHQLFAESVWQEATIAAHNFKTLNAQTEARTRELLERSGLAERHAEHPYRLSYGQKRRLNLVSILSYAPRLILLDEVLIGQDPANVNFILTLLQACIEAGSSVVMINHNPLITRRYAQRVLFLDSGRLLVDAPPQAAFKTLRDSGFAHYALAENEGLPR